MDRCVAHGNSLDTRFSCVLVHIILEDQTFNFLSKMDFYWSQYDICRPVWLVLPPIGFCSLIDWFMYKMYYIIFMLKVHFGNNIAFCVFEIRIRLAIFTLKCQISSKKKIWNRSPWQHGHLDRSETSIFIHGKSNPLKNQISLSSNYFKIMARKSVAILRGKISFRFYCCIILFSMLNYHCR